MKFANKYELFELLTTGTVETFVARDVRSAERVLVHIFESLQQRSDQPTIQWVLESFRSVAPAPPGLVVDAGRYTGTAYAYLVTKVPEEAALQDWVQSYEASQQAKEMSPSQQKATTRAAGTDDNLQPRFPAVASPASIRATKEPGEFTKAFLAVGPSSGIDRSSGSKSADFGLLSDEPGKVAAPPEPGSFTQQFFAGSEEEIKEPERLSVSRSAQKAPEPNNLSEEFLHDMGTLPDAATPGSKQPAAGRSPDLPVTPTFSGSPGAGSFTNLFRSSAAPEVKSTELTGDSIRIDQAKAGEFTAFFRGPFDGERPVQTPEIVSNVEQPRGPVPGDFTIMFGRKNGVSAEPVAESPLDKLPPESEPGAFTHVFTSPEGPAKPPSPYEPVAQPELRTEVSPRFPTSGGLAAPPKIAIEEEAPATPLSPASPSSPFTPPASIAKSKPSAVSAPPVQLDEPLFARRAEPEGATRIFSQPEAPMPGQALPLPAGPSEYTRIINGPILPPVEEPPVAAGSRAIPVPIVPGLKPPPAPKMPPPPKLAPPPAPKIPQPKISPPDLAAPKVSYWPLILTLNGLFIVAVLLVLYFALKR
jgi:hypothetical protein